MIDDTNEANFPRNEAERLKEALEEAQERIKELEAMNDLKLDEDDAVSKHLDDMEKKCRTWQGRAEKAEKWGQDMVAKVASGGTLDAYREMGQKLAEAERRAEAAEAQTERLRKGILQTAQRLDGYYEPMSLLPPELEGLSGWGCHDLAQEMLRLIEEDDDG